MIAYRPDIDGLRAIAVLSVLVFHAFPAIGPGGFVGVDVFFVISGYLITGIILKGLGAGTFRIRDFYERRVRRIFPALAVLLAFVLVVGWFTSMPADFAALGKHTAAGALFASNVAALLEAGYFDAGAEAKPLLHLWSLGIEEQFYLLWPIFLMVLVRKTNRPVLAVVGAALLSFLGSCWLSWASPDVAYYLPFTRFWELLVGSLLSMYRLSAHAGVSPIPLVGNIRRGLSEALAVSGLVAIAVASVALDGSVPFPGFAALLPVLGAAAVIATGPDGWVHRKLLSQRFLVLVGLISYPLYLWHWPLLVFARGLDPRLAQHFNDRLLRLSVLALSVGAAWATYRLVEERARRARGTMAVFALCAAVGVLGTLGALVSASGGVPGRYNSTQLAIDSTAESFALGHKALYREGRCFLTGSQRAKDFAQECFGADGLGALGQSHLVLWGDSHAAHLLPGMRDLAYSSGLVLAQFTTANCPPILGYDSTIRPQCAATNNQVLTLIAAARPSVVVLAAAWPSYPLEGLGESVARLKEAGVALVVLVGPVAMFADSQPRLLFRAAGNGHVPAQLFTPLLVDLRRIDRELRAQAREAGAEYASPLDVSCTADTCLVALDGRAENLMAWDSSHLTQVGAKYIVDRCIAGWVEGWKSGARRPVTPQTTGSPIDVDTVPQTPSEGQPAP